MKPKKKDRVEIVAISLPKSLVEFIDAQRGDIPRSKFIRRIIELFLGVKPR